MGSLGLLGKREGDLHESLQVMKWPIHIHKVRMFNVITVLVATLIQIMAFDANADGSLEIIGVYVDSTSYPKLAPEIVLYKQESKISGTYRPGYQNPKNLRNLFWGPSPLENIRLTSDGELSFSVPWVEGNPQVGFQKKRHHFNGKIHNDIIQGTFSSDWPSLRPPPIRASKRTSAQLNQDVFEYVLASARSASESIQDLDDVLKCQENRNRLPNGIEVIGRWQKLEANGEHEWGYDLILFQLDNKIYGWIEDYSGLIGDGGIRFLLGDVRRSNDKLIIKTNSKMEYEAILKGSRLELSTSGEVTFLEEQKLPRVEWVWEQYQALSAKCEYTPWK